MDQPAAEQLVLLARIYVGLGLLVSPAAIFGAGDRLDPALPGSGLGAKLALLPGGLLFWPLLLKRIALGAGRGRRGPREGRRNSPSGPRGKA